MIGTRPGQANASLSPVPATRPQCVFALPAQASAVTRSIGCAPHERGDVSREPCGQAAGSVHTNADHRPAVFHLRFRDLMNGPLMQFVKLAFELETVNALPVLMVFYLSYLFARVAGRGVPAPRRHEERHGAKRSVRSACCRMTLRAWQPPTQRNSSLSQVIAAILQRAGARICRAGRGPRRAGDLDRWPPTCLIRCCDLRFT